MGNSQIWAPVVAALGASILTVLATFGAIGLQRRWSARDAAQQEKLAAYSDLIAFSLTIIFRAQAAGLAVRFRSGLGEGIDVLLGRRRPIDPFELHDWMGADTRPIVNAWSRVQIVGSQEAMDVADRLVDACSEFVAAATASDKERNPIARTVRGEAPSKAQVEACQKILERLARERVALIKIARKETGKRGLIFAMDRGGLAPEPTPVVSTKDKEPAKLR